MCLKERAKNFFAELHVHRIGSNGRPVVFLGHSMGGLVIKAALVHAREVARETTNPELATYAACLLESVRGVVFYGTPHMGSDLADWVKYFRIGRHTPAIDTLEAFNMNLKELQDAFVALNVGSVSFYEKEPLKVTTFVSAIIVPRESADMALPQHDAVATDTDHSTVCKPLSTEDLIRLIYTRTVESLERWLNP